MRRRRFAVPIAVLAGFAAIGFLIVSAAATASTSTRRCTRCSRRRSASRAPPASSRWRAGGCRCACSALVAGLALGVGIVASDLLVYSGTWVTPKERFAR